MNRRLARILFIEMMGEPGTYDASVYDHFEDKDKEGVWFIKRFEQFPGITIELCNICIGDPLPIAQEIDGLVLAGSYNSVHDHTEWQNRIRRWFPAVIENKIPLLGVCGSHQLIAHMFGANVEKLEDGPFAGTFPITLTQAGKVSPLMKGIGNEDCFQYANGEHVTTIPSYCSLLARSPKVPVAALDYGNHCYTTQFHPEGTAETLSAVWRHKRPRLVKNYHSEENGYKLINNFLQIVVDKTLAP